PVRSPLLAIPCGAGRGDAPGIQVHRDGTLRFARSESLEYFADDGCLRGNDLALGIAIGFAAGWLTLARPALQAPARAAANLAAICFAARTQHGGKDAGRLLSGVEILCHYLDTEVRELGQPRRLLGEIAPQPRTVLGQDDFESALPRRFYHVLVAGATRGAAGNRRIREACYDREIVLRGQPIADAKLIGDRSVTLQLGRKAGV